MTGHARLKCQFPTKPHVCCSIFICMLCTFHLTGNCTGQPQCILNTWSSLTVLQCSILKLSMQPKNFWGPWRQTLLAYLRTRYYQVNVAQHMTQLDATKLSICFWLRCHHILSLGINSISESWIWHMLINVFDSICCFPADFDDALKLTTAKLTHPTRDRPKIENKRPPSSHGSVNENVSFNSLPHLAPFLYFSCFLVCFESRSRQNCGCHFGNKG